MNGMEEGKWMVWFWWRDFLVHSLISSPPPICQVNSSSSPEALDQTNKLRSPALLLLARIRLVDEWAESHTRHHRRISWMCWCGRISWPRAIRRCCGCFASGCSSLASVLTFWFLMSIGGIKSSSERWKTNEERLINVVIVEKTEKLASDMREFGGSDENKE